MNWIDPNDKNQAQYLPHIGEKVLFCYSGVTFWGIHTGGSFKSGHGVCSKYFPTWDCFWMYPRKEVQNDPHLDQPILP